MSGWLRPRWLALWAILLGVCWACLPGVSLDLGKATRIAPGVELYHVTDRRLLDTPGPIDISLLKVDLNHADLETALAHDEIMGPETVTEIAARHHAIAAINAGYFSTTSGEPAGLLKVGGELVSDTTLARGAVAVMRRSSGSAERLLFDRVRARVTLQVERGGERLEAPIDGVDTTRTRGHLMLFTPRYHADTDTAPTGTEWQLRGNPLRVVDRRANAGKMPIPKDGVVLSFGGTVLPTALEALETGQNVRLDTRFEAELGSSASDWASASDIIGGAGLLIFRGRSLNEWTTERLRDGFDTERHPRTVIGATRADVVWLIAVDGRNPQLSVGMSFRELQKLGQALRLAYALNLDGGGSTTMVVRGTIVNHPSDATGPREVSDAVLVVPKRH